ncbi:MULTISPECIES: VCBS repeat-containing protein [Flavobacteriaceae]|uniref:VCBS repeat-containing protein n=1 Tax=Flavobacteriaceae TaxID=49546 RepID=UPI001492B679|nr:MULTISPECIES: VCBS repeat-containing protein [Allomuricauda]MDC6366779.1 VCBS repeat-containing protein [Muricauda sp. AC10]
MINDTKEYNILKYANFYGGAGVGIGDFNGDGLQDLFFAGNLVPDRLYLNKGNLSFEDVTEQSGIIHDGGWSTGVTLADINNDGHLDIYVSRELHDENPEWRANLLYINKGDGTFLEKGEEFGVDDNDRTRHASFFDYDKDGLLDLFLLTQPPNPGSLSVFMGTELLKPEYSLRLLKNKGDYFEDVTLIAGLNRTGFPNATSTSDYNGDGWPDIYVANDFYAPDFLFINNQDGTFTNVANQAFKHLSYYSMGVDVADIDNDEHLDIFVLDMVAEDNFRLKSNMSGMDRQSFWDVYNQGGHYQYMFNTLQLNNGNTTFSDIAQFTEMAATDWSWSNLLADFDNDGLKDVFVTNGLLRDIRNTDADKAVEQYINQTRLNWLQNHPDGGELQNIFDIIDLNEVAKLIPSQPLMNYSFKNQGDLNFEKVMEEWGLDQTSFSNGAAYGDLDNDGDLDLVVNNINAKAFIYQNNSESIDGGNYLRVSLKDEKNQPLYGTRAKLYVDGEVQMIETTNVRGIYSTSEPFVHFGLGHHTNADSLVVIWPNQKKQVFKNVGANQVLVANLEEANAQYQSKQTSEPILMEVTEDFQIKHKHQENTFDDFAVQVLLPHKMSQMGPAMAMGDINNDGLDDVYIGASTGNPGALFVQETKGNYVQTNQDILSKEAPYEDVDAIFVDINRDGFQDLFVVSGGNEYSTFDLHYTDRLYLNDGQGNFKKGAILNASRMSGSKAITADYDGDGDEDIFVGGRHNPHNYPSPATSTLYVNTDGQLVNANEDYAPDFKNLGMVTDAVWMDYDSDSDLDLIVVGEWMPITVFSNENGKLIQTNIPSLQSTRGWWFSLEKGDFDGDGDMDMIAGNLGLNYKYKTSPEAPFDIYYEDFDNNGSRDIVLGYYNDEKHYPLRGFSCSSEQIPGLKKQIKKYDIFADMEIEEVYGTSNLKKALHYETDTFASVYIENLGNGTFKLSQLPTNAQLTNINDILVEDINSDGFLDAICVGNLFVSEIETPKNDAGIGAVLLGDGKGGFNAIHHSQSGFFAAGDAKKIEMFNHDGKPTIAVANNNDAIQFFKWK